MKDLKQKVEELQVSIRLEQHHRVSELANQISRKLVSLFDAQLDQQSDSSEPVDGISRTKLGENLSLIHKLCDGLRKLSQLTTIYHNVVEFVRVQDLIAHGHIVGAFDIKPKQSGEPVCEKFDPDELLKILRQSMIILRDINSSSNTYHLARESGSSMMQYNFVRKSRAGFTRFELDLRELQPIIKSQDAAKEDKSLIPCLRGMANYHDDESESLIGILSSEWFVEFVEFALERKYPFDKFTVLVALLIVGIECNHKTFQQLISSLIGQVFHQETTSGNPEELIQLKQVGSFWLSHRKRFSSTFVHQLPTSTTRLDHTDDIDDCGSDSDETEEDLEDEVESSLSDELDKSFADEGTRNSAKSSINQLQDKQIELRKIIDQEILVGESCPLCGNQFNVTSLDTLESVACTNCQSNRFLDYCSLSHKTVELLPLVDLVNFFPNLEKIILVKPNEWMSNVLNVANEMKVFSWLRATRSHEGVSAAERFDTSENYERLTVIRDRLPADVIESTRQLAGNYGSDSSSSLDTDDDERSDQKLVSDTAIVDDYEGECANILLNFMRKRLRAARCSSQSSSIRLHFNTNADSESLQLIKFVDRHTTRVLPVCSADLLVSDSLGKLLNVALILNSNLNQPTTPSGHRLGAVNVDLILACRRRSATSGLMIGCNRLYNPSEMIHHHGEPIMELNFLCQNSVTCPSCRDDLCQLIELKPGLNRPICTD